MALSLRLFLFFLVKSVFHSSKQIYHAMQYPLRKLIPTQIFVYRLDRIVILTPFKLKSAFFLINIFTISSLPLLTAK